MALQKRRMGRSRIRNRRAAWMRSMKKPLVGTCPNCGEPRLPHRVCLHCGQYNGESILEASEERE
ncbi:MAG TPA: 50S ribosomal protein L32 [Candidatus Acidoferrum sp.]|nr:50S ribosomal protein L32 [Candidatus Acidoferrum sp.]